MNEHSSKPSQQLTEDVRTGLPTAIDGQGACDEQRTACASLNRKRARSILAAAQQDAPGESVSADVWDADFERRAKAGGVPLVPVELLGVSHTELGFTFPNEPSIEMLPSGAEAAPFLDKDRKIVYKLFDLRDNGSMGKKIRLESDDDRFQICTEDARLTDTLEKLELLNAVGAHPTEIVGLSDDAHYLIVKQPMADHISSESFSSDRDRALRDIHGVVFGFPNFRSNGTAAAIWGLNAPWLLGDLHERNIMRNNHGEPTIIDALVGRIDSSVLRQIRNLAIAVNDARCLRLDLPLPERQLFDDVNDDEL